VVGDSLPFVLGKAEHTDLSFMQVAMHLVGRLADVAQVEGAGEHRVDHSLGDETIGLEGLAVVGEV